MSFRALNREFDEVVIIDLLPPHERQQWHLSEDLRDWLAERGVNQVQVSCYTKRHVFDALDWSFNRLSHKNFILHFTAHGNTQGIGLKRTNEFISWDELRKPLQRLNQALDGDLIINMTACKGFHGTQIQSLEDANKPFFGLVGPTKDIAPEAARKASEQFYDGILDGGDIPKIVQDINAAAGDQIVWCRSSQFIRGTSNLSI